MILQETTLLGPILLRAEAGVLVALEFHAGNAPEEPGSAADAALLAEAWRQLREYLEGRRRTFDLPLAPRGTAFQRRVWAELARIPYGETRSYGEVARAIGQPGASRAVGLANNRNPLPIFIPCHRVIGADGKLIGYGGGLEIKVALLGLESGDRLL